MNLKRVSIELELRERGGERERERGRKALGRTCIPIIIIPGLTDLLLVTLAPPASFLLEGLDEASSSTRSTAFLIALVVEGGGAVPLLVLDAEPGWTDDDPLLAMARAPADWTRTRPEEMVGVTSNPANSSSSSSSTILPNPDPSTRGSNSLPPPPLSNCLLFSSHSSSSSSSTCSPPPAAILLALLLLIARALDSCSVNCNNCSRSACWAFLASRKACEGREGSGSKWESSSSESEWEWEEEEASSSERSGEPSEEAKSEPEPEPRPPIAKAPLLVALRTPLSCTISIVSKSIISSSSSGNHLVLHLREFEPPPEEEEAEEGRRRRFS